MCNLLGSRGVVLCGFAAFVSCATLMTRSGPPAEVLWPHEDWNRPPPPDTCRRTRFMPFLAGCPKSCADLRPDKPTERFYKTAVIWRLGRLKEIHNATAAAALTDTAMAQRFTADAAYIHAFAGAEQSLTEQQAQETQALGLGPLSLSQQRNVHMSLAYLCCLTSTEMATVNEVVGRWLQQQMHVDFQAVFDRVECWQERVDSITNIIVANEATQRTVMKLYQSLLRSIEDAGVPQPVQRDDQMPFHMTLLGLRTVGSDISAYLTPVARAVDAATRHFAGGVSTRIRGAPKLDEPTPEVEPRRALSSAASSFDNACEALLWGRALRVCDASSAALCPPSVKKCRAEISMFGLGTTPADMGRISQLKEMGFSDEVSRRVLAECAWDVNKAIDRLLLSGVPDDMPQQGDSEKPGTGDPPEVPEEPDDLDASAEARSSDHVGDVNGKSSFFPAQEESTLEAAKDAEAPATAATSQNGGVPAEQQPEAAAATSEVASSGTPLVAAAEPAAQPPAATPAAPTKRLERAKQAWTAGDPSQLSVSDQEFVYVWTATATENGWIHAELAKDQAKVGWLPRLVLTELQEGQRWMKAKTKWEARDESQCSVEIGEFCLVWVSSLTKEGWTYVDCQDAALFCRIVPARAGCQISAWCGPSSQYLPRASWTAGAESFFGTPNPDTLQLPRISLQTSLLALGPEDAAITLPRQSTPLLSASPLPPPPPPPPPPHCVAAYRHRVGRPL
ncbi:unnamed protein product [Symbiodinium sp. CCMP2456]|nr:unnamed protein product [Symbiodinium sp. CCMP2456]